jgi:hypothetical protein
MRNDGIATTVMLGLRRFRVLAVSEYDGEVEQAVETTADEGWCLTSMSSVGSAGATDTRWWPGRSTATWTA